MVKRMVLVALCAIALLPAGGAAGAAGLHGRSIRTQAALDAQQWDDTGRVQVLARVCERPSRLRGCVPITTRLRAALAAAIAAPITWVQRRRVRGPDFLVFAPIVFDGSEAKAEVAYWAAGRFGCRGGYTTRYRRQHGAWTWFLQLGWALCSAGPA